MANIILYHSPFTVIVRFVHLCRFLACVETDEQHVLRSQEAHELRQKARCLFASKVTDAEKTKSSVDGLDMVQVST